MFEAIRQALYFLSFDELPNDERPPKRIWLDGEKLNAWFERVERKRKDEMGGRNRTIEDPVENELTAEMFGNG